MTQGSQMEQDQLLKARFEAAFRSAPVSAEPAQILADLRARGMTGVLGVTTLPMSPCVRVIGVEPPEIHIWSEFFADRPDLVMNCDENGNTDPETWWGRGPEGADPTGWNAVYAANFTPPTPPQFPPSQLPTPAMPMITHADPPTTPMEQSQNVLGVAIPTYTDPAAMPQDQAFADVFGPYDPNATVSDLSDQVRTVKL